MKNVVSLKTQKTVAEQLREMADLLENGSLPAPPYALVVFAPATDEDFLDVLEIPGVRKPSRMEVVGVLATASTMSACSTMDEVVTETFI